MVSDASKGMSILNRRHSRWGDHNLMELSYVGQLRAFIASKSVKVLVSKKVKAPHANVFTLSVMVGYLLFPFAAL